MAARRVFAAVVFLSFLIPSPGFLTAAAQEDGGEITRDTAYVPGQVVVAMDVGRSLSAYAADAAGLAQGIGASPRAVARDGTAVFQADPEADVMALAAALAEQRGVRYAEPNYVYWIPEPAAGIDGFKATASYVLRRATDMIETAGREFFALEIGALQSMKSKRGGEIKATYPND